MDNNTDTAKIFKAFCDENRIEILKTLKLGEQCAMQIIGHLDIGQPTLSHHMKILCESGIVKSRRSGKQIMYSLNTEGIADMRLALDSILPADVKTARGIDVVLL